VRRLIKVRIEVSLAVFARRAVGGVRRLARARDLPRRRVEQGDAHSGLLGGFGGPARRENCRSRAAETIARTSKRAPIRAESPGRAELGPTRGLGPSRF